MSSPLIVVATLEARAGHAEAAEAALRVAVEGSRKESGCLAYDLHQDLEESRRWVMIERWESEDALQQHLAGEVFQTLAQALDGRVDVDIRKLTRLL